MSVLENTPKEDVLTALFLGVLGLFTHPAIAQDGEGASEEEVSESEAPYVPSFLGNRPGKGAFFAPSTRVTGFGSQGAITVGGRAGWIYHHSLALGVEGHILASPTVWHPEGQELLSMTYAGLFAQGILWSDREIHGQLQLFWGFGEAHYRKSWAVEEISEVTPLWVVELQALLVYSPMDWLQVQAGPGMRVAPGASLSALEGRDFWRPYGEVSVAVGLF